MVDDCAVAHVKVQKRLYAMILLVKEVHLVLQFLHVALIGVLLVLQSELVHVLSTLVELAQSENLVVSLFNGVIRPLELLLDGEVSLDKLLVLVAQFIGSLVSPTQLIGPLMVLHGHPTRVQTNRILLAFITFTVVVRLLKVCTTTDQVLTELEVLCGATEHIMKLAI